MTYKTSSQTNYANQSSSGSSSYSRSRYETSGRYATQDHGYAKPNEVGYNLKSDRSHLSYARPTLKYAKPNLTYKRPKLYIERPELYFQKPELDLRTLCPLCNQPVAKAA